MENDDNKLLKEIKEIKRRLGAIERETMSSLEDQLFFGLVFSLAVFFLAFPAFNVVSFLQSSMNFDYDLAMNTAEGMKYSGILFLVIISAMRYYGAISPTRTSKKLRVLSFQLLMLMANFLLLFLVLNSTTSLSVILGITTIPTAISILLIIYVLLAIVEKRVLGFYASRKLILKKDVEPLASLVSILATLSVALTIIIILSVRSMDLTIPPVLNFPTLMLVLFLLVAVWRLIQKRRRLKRVQK